jgi:diguanylate cyclase (GGDEF)-like protein
VNPLDRIEAAQLRSLERIRQDGPDRALLVQLIEASCLLELAKLDATRLDPSTYLQLAVDIVAQMYPVGGCAATVADGTRTLEVHSGRITGEGERSPLVVQGNTIGVLVTGAVTGDLGSPVHFFDRAADQIARGIATALDAERLRRDAAIATAARIASELTPDDVVDGLEELALALASFPSVMAAELVIDHAAIGPPLHLRAGYWDDDGRAHSIGSFALDLATTGRLAVRLRSNDEQLPDDDAVGEVLAGLAGSLDRLLQTQRLVEDAETDALSGLGNRRRLERSLVHALSRAERYGERVALMLIDLDRFKAVNDILGHETGDEVIVQCANAMRERVRAYDEAIRLGGDEFVVVAPVPDVLDALELADSLRVEIGQRCAAVLPPDWGLSATIGVALYPDSGPDQETLLRAADEALYRAKGDGRDAVAIAELSSTATDQLPDE